jgi:hypothetical protein
MEDVWAPENSEYTRFFEAVEEGDVAGLDRTFMSNIHFNIDALRSNGQGSEGMAALHMAAGKGHAEMVKFLLDDGADIDIRDRDLTGNSTPLHHAAFDCHTDIIRTLLENGAEARATGSFGGTALHQVLRDKFEVGEEHLRTVTLLLDCGLDINAVEGEMGDTVVRVTMRRIFGSTADRITASSSLTAETYRSHQAAT